MTTSRCDCALNNYFSDEKIEEKIRLLSPKEESLPNSWNIFYECPRCESVWELVYPEHCGQCGGTDPVLMRISAGYRNK